MALGEVRPLLPDLVRLSQSLRFDLFFKLLPALVKKVR